MGIYRKLIREKIKLQARSFSSSVISKFHFVCGILLVLVKCNFLDKSKITNIVHLST